MFQKENIFVENAMMRENARWQDAPQYGELLKSHHHHHLLLLEFDMSETPLILYANAADEGLQFVLPSTSYATDQNGGLAREEDRGHVATVVGKGGTGKSMLALQVLAQLLDDAKDVYRPLDKARWGSRPHAAFYFTLEASPYELACQLSDFQWGRWLVGGGMPKRDQQEWTSTGGLHVVTLPPPVPSLTTLHHHIRQTIARSLPKVARVVAIVIDPVGGVDLGDDVRNEMPQIRSLADSHRCFLFLLVEDYIFARHGSIEHYSQTVLHLDHNPSRPPHRRLYIQKVRGQSFSSGYHQLAIDEERGMFVFPSVQAQSSYAHQLLAQRISKDEGAPGLVGTTESLGDQPGEGGEGELLSKIDGKHLDFKVYPGSVVFLMGPPGTFKQRIATSFASYHEDGADVYISFKAEFSSVESSMPEGRTVVTLPRNVRYAEISNRLAEKDPDCTGNVSCFLDARNPLCTPEEILGLVRNLVVQKPRVFRRAVVWGLRRLADMPNFAGDKAVQFLEALVTLLKSQGMISLLVDWPDVRATTLPIVDLSQYILLTRVCRSKDSFAEGDLKNEELRGDLDKLWGKNREHVALLRVQRDNMGFHRGKGSLMFAKKTGLGMEIPKAMLFQRYWLKVGQQWEQDPGLVH